MAHPSGTPQGVEGPGEKPSAPPWLGESPAHSEELECGICRSAFDSERHVPKLLECLHTFCLECVKQLHLRAAAGQAEGTAILCPLCRHSTALPGGRVQNLLVNTKLAKTFPPAGGDNLPPPQPEETLASSPQRPLPEGSAGRQIPVIAARETKADCEAVKICCALVFFVAGLISGGMAAHFAIYGTHTHMFIIPLLFFVSGFCFMMICGICGCSRIAVPEVRRPRHHFAHEDSGWGVGLSAAHGWSGGAAAFPSWGGHESHVGESGWGGCHVDSGMPSGDCGGGGCSMDSGMPSGDCGGGGCHVDSGMPSGDSGWGGCHVDSGMPSGDSGWGGCSMDSGMPSGDCGGGGCSMDSGAGGGCGD